MKKCYECGKEIASGEEMTLDHLNYAHRDCIMGDEGEEKKTHSAIAFEYARVKEQRFAIAIGINNLNAVSSNVSTAGIGPDVYENIRAIRKALESADDKLFDVEQELYHNVLKMEQQKVEVSQAVWDEFKEYCTGDTESLEKMMKDWCANR